MFSVSAYGNLHYSLPCVNSLGMESHWGKGGKGGRGSSGERVLSGVTKRFNCISRHSVAIHLCLYSGLLACLVRYYGATSGENSH